MITGVWFDEASIFDAIEFERVQAMVDRAKKVGIVIAVTNEMAINSQIIAERLKYKESNLLWEELPKSPVNNKPYFRQFEKRSRW